jgi:hypothetical protein
MDKFKEALEVCELDDLGFVGDAFTWRNRNHDASKYIRERLDRAVATQTRRERFPSYKFINGDPRHSDHHPVIVETHGLQRASRAPAREFMPKFEAKWLAEEDYKDIVQNTWEKEIHANHKSVGGL